MNLYGVTTCLTSIISIGLAAFIYLKNIRGAVNRTAGLFLSAFGWFNVFLSLLYFSNNEAQAGIYAKTLNAGGFFIPSTFLHFSLVLTNNYAKKKKLAFWCYGASFLLLSLIATPLIIEGASKKLSQRYYYPDAGPLYPLYIIIFFLSWVYAEYIIFKEMKRSQDAQRRIQFRHIFIATTAGFLCGFNYIPLVIGIRIPPIGGHFISLSFIYITYSILKYKTLDINLVIRKTLIYSILIALITTIYLIGVLLTEKYFQNIIGYKSLILTVIIAAAIAIFFIPVKNGVQSFLDRFFFKGTLESLASEKERLQQEIHRAQRLRAVGTLAAEMAHEIKNPLTSIKTFTEYLPEMHNDPEFIAKFQRVVGPEVDKIDGIVKQLLDFAKPRPPELKDVDIQSMLDETLELLSSNFTKYNIAVIKNYPASQAVTKADYTQLKQAFLNIILNSIDAMKENGGKLVLSINKSYDTINIAIEDTGCGINKNDIEHLFDPFYTTKERNTGLGLSVVHSIIEKHKGRITVDSAPGVGTRFTLYIPM